MFLFLLAAVGTPIKSCAVVQPRWIQGFQRGDGYGDQETIDQLSVNERYKEWLNRDSSVGKFSGEKRLNNLVYVES